MSFALLVSANKVQWGAGAVYQMDPTAATPPALLWTLSFPSGVRFYSAVGGPPGSLFTLTRDTIAGQTQIRLHNVNPGMDGMDAGQVVGMLPSGFSLPAAIMQWDDTMGRLWISAWDQSSDSIYQWTPQHGVRVAFSGGVQGGGAVTACIGPDGSLVRSQQFAEILAVKDTGNGFSYTYLTADMSLNWTKVARWGEFLYLSAYGSNPPIVRIQWDGVQYMPPESVNIANLPTTLLSVAVADTVTLFGEYNQPRYGGNPPVSASTLPPVSGADPKPLWFFWALSDCAAAMASSGQQLFAVRTSGSPSYSSPIQVSGDGQAFTNTLHELVPPPAGGLFVGRSGGWKQAAAYIGRGGVWKPSAVSVGQGGVWK